MKKTFTIQWKQFVTAVFLFCGVHITMAQHLVTGTVKDEEDVGLAGVTIMIEGTSQGTATDMDGKYSIKVPNDARLLFAFIGYENQTVAVNNRPEINVKMELDITSLQEVVVIGYGTQEKRDVTGAISSVSAEEIDQRVPVSVFESLQGRVAGVQIVTADGEPGAGAQIRIRGTSTFNAGVDPLYIVDGQQVDDIDNLNPQDIESMEILKDGSSAAIYGSRSANGVVIITTKSGTAGKPEIGVSYVRSYSKLINPLSRMTTLERSEYGSLHNQRGGNERSVRDSLSELYYNDFDMLDMVTRIGKKDQVNVSASGGTDNTKYYVNTGYIKQQGVANNNDFSRLNTTFNLSFKPASWLKNSTRINASFDKKNGADIGSVFFQSFTRLPWLRYEEDGELIPPDEGAVNPLAFTELLKLETKNYRGSIFESFEFDLTRGLKLKANAALNIRYNTFHRFRPSALVRRNPGDNLYRTRLFTNWQQENYLTYTKRINKHRLDAVAGVSFQKWSQTESSIDASQVATDKIETLNNSSVLDQENTITSVTEHSLVSAFARVAYNYKGRYLLNTTFRRDGSSRFGTNSKYGNFPAVSIGWRFIDEPFMNFADRVLADAKLRAGYAITGNERIDNFDSRSLFSLGSFYNGVNGIVPNQLGNDLLSWESTRQTNFGADISLFGGRVDITGDYYIKQTDDLLYDIPIPAESGYSNVRSNVGEIENKGWEVSLSALLIDKNDFAWNATFNIARNQNEVVSLSGGIPFTSGNFIIEEGQPIGNMYGYRKLGIYAYDESNAYWQDEEGVYHQVTPNFDEDNNFLKYTFNGQEVDPASVTKRRVSGTEVGGGDVIWEDLNGDNKIDDKDRQVLGNGIPDFFGGLYNQLTWKNLTLSFLFDYSFRAEIYNRDRELRYTYQIYNRTPGPDILDLAWREPGDEAEFAIINGKRPYNRLEPSSQFIEDGSFIKLRNVRMGYDLPAGITSKIGISRINAYVLVNNVMTWTNYKGFDPEIVTGNDPLQIGLDNNRYPRSREFLAGLSLTF